MDMKEFYRKQMRKTRLLLDMATIGYQAKVKELGRDLAESTEDNSEDIIEQIKVMKETIADVVKDLGYYTENYMKEGKEEKDERENV